MELRLLTEQPSYLLPLVHASLASKRTRTIFSCTVPRCYQRGEQERPRENRAKNPKKKSEKKKTKKKGREKKQFLALERREDTGWTRKSGERETKPRRFRNRIIYSRRGAILGRPIVKLEARLMDPQCPRAW